MERSKKRSLAQTPAPAKDKIYGSKVNKKGSASSESNAERIKLSDAIVSVLEGKMEEHNAEYPNRKVTLAVLKAVFRRGAGAYSRSHRPTISGGKPNSRTAWAYARVNKFLEKKAGKQVKKAYVQDDDLIGKYAKGGEIQNMIDNGTIELKMYDTKPEHAEIYGLKSKSPLYVQRVFVDEKQRLNGLGTKILKYLDEYAKSNNHDLIFGHIAEKSEPNVKIIKTMLEKAGFTTIEGNNDFYKYVDSDNYQLPDSTKFMRWWIEWYKPIVDKFNIYISFPLDSSEFPESNVVIMDLFEKKDQEIDAKPYLNEIVKKADEYGTTIYLTPKPRYKYFTKDSEKGRRVTKEYLIEYYKKFGFELTDGDYMKRLPKKKYHLGGDMSKHLAPNGKPSNLTHEQWHLVRTPEFKAWFGDWENDPENSSKVVDENGEPLVVYHGTNNEFYEFEVDKQRIGWLGKGFYFSENKIEAKDYGKRLLKVFLNIKNPFIVQGDIPNEDGTIKWALNREGQISEKYNEVNATDISTTLKKFNNDGILEGNMISCFYPEQIKLADGSNTTFDGNNPDIRYAKGGAIKQGKGDCYQTSGNIAIDGGIKGVKFVGKPYLVQAEVQGQGSIRGLRYGHSWIEDDELVYDYSNERTLQIPKIIYYLLGDIKTVKPKYYRYTFAQAKKKMLETGHYGSWELETESGL